jgi:hypothetical protein
MRSNMTRFVKLFMVLACLGVALADTGSKKKEIEGPVIGIDLGTTYSCVGIFKNGRVEIIPNELGNRITPSYVAFTDDEKLVGEAAKNQASANPVRTVYVIKRLIGRNFEDKEVQRDKKYVPYKIVSKSGKPYVSVETPQGVKELSPEEVSAMILVKMKEVAEAYLGKEVKYAVVTVLMFLESLMSQLLPLLPTDLTRSLERRTLLFLILEVVLSMFPSLPLITECSRSLPLLEIPILEERISIKDSLSISSRSSRRRTTMSISRRTQELSKN